MLEMLIEAKLRDLMDNKDCPILLGKEVKPMEQLKSFNFWSKKIDYRPLYSAQSILDINNASKEQTCSTGGCTSDQAGSQENGGMDCSEAGPD